MDLTKLQRRKREKKIPVSIKITKEKSDFMRKHNLSPTAVFNEKIEELQGKLK